jgi:division protein CdvB (Snf7/Vps24/ESCRT-III family)
MIKIVQDLRTENTQFRQDIKTQVETINTKANKTFLPVTLEQDILKTAQQAIGESISKVMTGYDSPLVKLVKSVVDENSTTLRIIISESFKQVILTDEFKQSIVSAFSHKVARTIISNNDGLFDKVSNELKQDSVFKARMAMAVSNVVEECLRDRES